ncbi:hypothetical protein APA_1323 [Pseudanabaena sp. lw0831]|nr:hypothetical protein APA_1323 [Pseudanabaena sp. lw0831]
MLLICVALLYQSCKLGLNEIVALSEQIEIMKGRYCSVTCEFIRQTSVNTRWIGHYLWDTVGSDSGTDLEKIAYFISGLPDATLLEDGKNIHDGIGKEWVDRKDICIEIARCFLADKGQQNDPLIDILNIGDIEKFTYEFRWLETELYRNLWMMITSHSQEIVSNMKRIWEYPFSSDIELLCRIIQEDLEGEFVVYTQSFYQYHAKELDQIDKLKRKDHTDLTISVDTLLIMIILQMISRSDWLILHPLSQILHLVHSLKIYIPVDESSVIYQ